MRAMRSPPGARRLTAAARSRTYFHKRRKFLRPAQSRRPVYSFAISRSRLSRNEPPNSRAMASMSSRLRSVVCFDK